MKKIIFVVFYFLFQLVQAEIIKHGAFVLDYNEQYEIANWVAYSVTRNQVKHDSAIRKNYFKPDKLVKTKTAYPDDYKKSGYDRGHLAPADIFDYNQKYMNETFLMSNIVPQLPRFNRGVWKRIELYTQYIAVVYKKIYIVTGCVVLKPYKTIGKSKVVVPQFFYKVVFDKHKNFITALLVPHRNISVATPVSNFVVTLDYIEMLTQLHFKKIINHVK